MRTSSAGSVRAAQSWDNRFRGVYWRQLRVTAGMVLVTLILLGVVFFALSWFYTWRQGRDEAMERTERVIEQFSQDYLENGAFSTLTELQEDENVQRSARLMGAAFQVRLLICDRTGRVLRIDAPASSPEGGTVSPDAVAAPPLVSSSPHVPSAGQEPPSLPEDLTQQVLDEGFAAEWRELEGEGSCYLAGKPVLSRSGNPIGAAYAVSAAPSLGRMWKGLLALFIVTAFVVLLIATMAASVTAMHLAIPLREMVSATRRYAEGDFTLRMDGYDQNDEIGELAAAFNQMADSLQRQERQRREFISNLSHDMKTPLTTIAGYTDGILDGTIPRPSQRHYLEIISQESRRLSRMVRRMLDLSQLQAIDPMRSGDWFDICEIMRRVVISLEKRIRERGLDVRADIPDEPILALGDQDMITQVLYNLLDNAAKFARRGSTLYLGVVEQNGRARVAVRNQGETIPPEELPLLFERFHKSDKSRSEDKDGVGLGLYIVKTILAQHKEKIFVTSENGVTTFSFSLRTKRGGRLDDTV